MSTSIVIEGNITAEPSLKFTPNGHAVATFTVAVNNRGKKAGQWVDAPATYHDCEAWNRLAEHIAQYVHEVITGPLRCPGFGKKCPGRPPSRP